MTQAGDQPAAVAARARSRWAAVRTWSVVVALTALSGSLLIYNTAQTRVQPLGEMEASWRYWDDLALASSIWLRWQDYPGIASQGSARELDEAMPEFTRVVLRNVRRQAIAPHEFWRGVPAQPLAGTLRGLRPPQYEDVGRSRLLAAGFWLLGGVAPYLELWLCVLLCLPVLAWCLFELTSAGRPLAAAGFALLVVSSPYVFETLSLAHAAVGFYLLAGLGSVALGTYASMSASRSRVGLLVRLAAAALVFTLATLARSSAAFLFPAFVLAALWAVERVFARAAAPPGTPLARRLLRRALLASALGAALLLPYLAARPASYHNIWVSVWEGLGDFGADRGYSWYDNDAKRVLKRAGMVPFATPRHVTPEHERYFRWIVLRDVSQNPLWFASILAKRVAATTALTHLWPPTYYGFRWYPASAARRATRPPRFHYKYTTHADWLAFGAGHLRIPMPVLWLPFPILAGAWYRSRRRGFAARTEHLRSDGKLLTVVAAGTLGAPVLVSTASGIETQAFILVYYVAAGCALDALLGASGRGR